MFIPIAVIACFSFGQPKDPQATPDPVTTEIYNISDLMMKTPDYRDTVELDLQSALQANSQSPFREEQQTIEDTRKDADEIMSIIQSIVEPDAWGSTATMRYWKGNLIIKAPKSIHRQIR